MPTKIVNSEEYRKKVRKRKAEAKKRYHDKYKFANIMSSKPTRCKKDNIPWTLNTAWAKRTFTGRCSLTGIEFQYEKVNGEVNPRHPSIDRKIPKIGYHPENSRWVLLCVNQFKGVGDDNNMYEVAEALLRNRPKNQLGVCL